MTDPVVLWLDGELVDPAAAAVAWLSTIFAPSTIPGSICMMVSQQDG